MRIGIDARKIADYGIGTYVRGLLGALAELGGDTYVALAPAGSPIPRGIEHVVVDAPHYSVRELVIVGRAAAKARLDVFHAPHYVVPFTDIPVVVTVHDLIHLHQPARNPFAPVYARAMIGRAVRKAARVLTVSEAVRDDLVRDAACEPAKIVVTPNGVDDIYFTPGPVALGRYFLYAGNDKPHKNVGTLVDAFARVRKIRSDNLTLVLAGAPFDAYHDVDGVITAGFVSVEELAKLYRGAIALVLPSLEEGFGLPAAEAMACGTAVITSDASALVEITGDAAVHVGARSVDALAGAMERVARDDAFRASLGARGRKRASAFTWRACAEKTRAAYGAAR